MSESNRSQLRVALVGCGAVASASLLPVLAGHEGIVLGPLVDRDERRARELADAYGISAVFTDMERLTRDVVDAVVLATPPAHHAPATLSLAAKGLHVFVEKPMAIAAADAETMVRATDDAGVVLTVGLYRRFLPSVQLLQRLIDQQEFGRPLAVDAEEGGPYGWPLATLDGLRRSSGGGGPLIDLGSHVIDLVLFALRGAPRLVRYEDNERGGIETDCVLHTELATPSGLVPFRLELSRTRELRGSIRIECEQAVLELPRASFTEVIVHRKSKRPADAAVQLTASWKGAASFVGYEAFRREIDDWADAIANRTEPVLSGRSVVPVVRLIEVAYNNRTPLNEPGDAPPVVVLPVTHGTRTRVLVTGAGGFLGGRTVEVLRDHYGYDAIPLVREPKSAARLARWPHEIRLGNVCDREQMTRALDGCDAVVHCAVGTSWQRDVTRRVTVDGTRVTAEVAKAAGVKRFVHISTLFVHRRDGSGVLDERVALEPPPRDDYGQAKLAAERALASVAAQGLSTIVLRPTRIYGPFSRTFTIRPLQALAEGRLAILGNPDIPANMVYVDTVVDAIERALAAPDSLNGAAFLVTDEDQVSLREFYEYFGKPFGLELKFLPDTREPEPPVPGPLRQFVAGMKTIATSPEFRGFVRRVFETDPIGTLPRRMWERSPAVQQRMLRRFGSNPAVIYRRSADGDDLLPYYGEAARVSGEKARQELGLSPRFSRSQGMSQTLEWARYARLLGPRAVRVAVDQPA